MTLSRYLEPRAATTKSPSPAPATPASPSSSPAAPQNEHHLMMQKMATLARDVAHQAEQAAGKTGQISGALAEDALNGLANQLLTAVQGGQITVNYLKTHTPQILHACDLVETTQHNLGIPLDPKVAAAIKVVRAAAQVINAIPELSPITIPPLTDHLEGVLHGNASAKRKNNEEHDGRPTKRLKTEHPSIV